MNIAIILCMHGNLSKSLIKTVEIILGKQNNFGYVNFFIKDNLNKLKNSYLNVLNKLYIKDGIICMVDIWGGSAFNITYEIMKKNKYNYSIISGINILMLIDFFISKKNKNNITDITKSIINSGKIGINYSINN